MSAFTVRQLSNKISIKLYRTDVSWITEQREKKNGIDSDVFINGFLETGKIGGFQEGIYPKDFEMVCVVFFVSNGKNRSNNVDSEKVSRE